MQHLSKFSISDPKIDFEKVFQKLYGINELSRLHRYFEAPKSSLLPNDSSSLLHKIYYSNFESLFRPVYLALLGELSVIVPEPFYYQSIPNVRFGLPGQCWLSRFHTDLEYKHPPCEFNVNLAITDSFGSAALQIEDAPSSGSYIPLTQNKREYTFIDHISCRHGTVTNTEDYTLVSLDFRFVLQTDLPKLLNSSVDSSLTQHKRFQPGDYFSAEPYFP
tara:strand:- start:557 stop:1213 length:657 start_codon:yes stop_codon:yes gene_type:complete